MLRLNEGESKCKETHREASAMIQHNHVLDHSGLAGVFLGMSWYFLDFYLITCICLRGKDIVRMSFILLVHSSNTHEGQDSPDMGYGQLNHLTEHLSWLCIYFQTINNNFS